MNHWKYKTAAVILAGSVAAMSILEPVSAGTVTAGTDERMARELAEERRQQANSATPAKKVSLRDVKSAAKPEEESKEQAPVQAVGAAALYTASSESSTEAQDKTAQVSTEGTTESAQASAAASTEASAETTTGPEAATAV